MAIQNQQDLSSLNQERTASKIGACFVYPDESAVASALEDIFITKAQEAISERGRFRVALSGGSTPAAFFRRMRESARAHTLDWSRIVLFFCDERIVEVSSPSNNYGVAKKLWLSDLRFQKAQVIPMYAPETLDTAPTIREVVSNYEIALVHHKGMDDFLFDLTFLGIGEDGHTASLFVHTVKDDPSWIRGSKGLVRQSKATFAPYDRITLTFNALSMSREIIFHAVGIKKYDRVKQVLEGDQAIPAAQVSSQGALNLVLDREAGFGFKQVLDAK